MNNLTVSIFVRNKNSDPASYYRIIQYISKLQDLGTIEVFGFSPEFYYRRSSRKLLPLCKAIVYLSGCAKRLCQLLRLAFSKNDLVIFVQRELIPRKLPRLFAKLIERTMLKAKVIVWDFDDNIKGSGEISTKEFDLLCKYSTSILVCNGFLKSTLPESAQKKVTLIPTADRVAEDLNLGSINKMRLAALENDIVLIWLGTAGNLKYLVQILPELEKAATSVKKSGKQLHLRVVSNSKLDYNGIDLNIENVKWSRPMANDELKNAHIGLMPLEENYYTRGKCGFKAVQYIGMGLPAIVSDVGFNTEVVKDEYNGFAVVRREEWAERIVQLAFDLQLWERMSNNARTRWRESFSSKGVLEQLKDIIKSQQ